MPKSNLLSRILDPAETLTGQPLWLLAVVVVVLGAAAGIAASRSSNLAIGLLMFSLIIPSTWMANVRTKRGITPEPSREGCFVLIRVVIGTLVGIAVLGGAMFLVFRVGGSLAKDIFGVGFALIAPITFVFAVRQLSGESARRGVRASAFDTTPP